MLMIKGKSRLKQKEKGGASTKPWQGFHSASAEITETSPGRRVTDTGESKEGKTLRHSILAADSMIFNEERNNLVKAPGFGNKQFNTVQDFIYHFQRCNSDLIFSYNFTFYSMEFCSPSHSQKPVQCDDKSTPSTITEPHITSSKSKELN